MSALRVLCVTMAPSPRPLCDSSWWSFAGSTTLGSHSLCILSARQGAPPCFSRQVHGRAEESFSEKTVSLSRQPAATCARTCLPFSSSFAIPPRLGRVRQPPFGGPRHVLHYLARYTHRVAI